MCADGISEKYSVSDLDIDPLTSVSGFLVLLLSGGVVLLLGCVCISLCICCRCLKSIHPQFKGESAECGGGASPPEPPQFYPPSPPKIPLPATSTAFTPRKLPQLDGANVVHDGYRSVRIANEYGSPMDMNQHDYTYVRNDVHRNLL
ncbi:hypothetical protein ANCCAN_01224 [Ancylostoma caninum]|uniref:Uncharacterized protein n=1 Tax=Ancylostoma caninum TaxID=29170 RepID=A0A368H7G5_ANCCA|nr:hypothetical protein ANCCAN_01224 [Ancylostoma caninum]